MPRFIKAAVGKKKSANIELRKLDQISRFYDILHGLVGQRTKLPEDDVSSSTSSDEVQPDSTDSSDEENINPLVYIPGVADNPDALKVVFFKE